MKGKRDIRKILSTLLVFILLFSSFTAFTEKNLNEGVNSLKEELEEQAKKKIHPDVQKAIDKNEDVEVLVYLKDRVFDAVSKVSTGSGTIKGRVSIDGEDLDDPEIEHKPIKETFIGSDISIEAKIKDDVSIVESQLYVKQDSSKYWIVLPLKLESAAFNFFHWYETEARYDKGQVLITNDYGENWTKIGPEYSGDGKSWEEVSIDLNDYIGSKDPVFIGFRFTARGEKPTSLGVGWI
ncbi:immune inhibitor A, partial [Anaerosalibacter bizertensis]|nr:immune inhibitor A [Anaerosalibacter bizertensis]MCG4586395.1 immune inhibitor A [Anaerosalibacter bizertensis]